jgi:hypothetical protein
MREHWIANIFAMFGKHVLTDVDIPMDTNCVHEADSQEKLKKR